MSACQKRCRDTESLLLGSGRPGKPFSSEGERNKTKLKKKMKQCDKKIYIINIDQCGKSGRPELLVGVWL